MTSPPRRSPRRALAAAAALLTLTLACSDATGPVSPLEFARLRWAAAQPSAYRMVVSKACECTPEATAPVLISVEGGVVTHRAYVADGSAVDASLVAGFPTVDGLFAIIDDAIARDAARIDVTYEPRLGYPVRVAIDSHATMVDDEVTYTVHDFTALAPPMP